MPPSAWSNFQTSGKAAQMNQSTEIIIRWHLGEQGHEEDFTDDLVKTLYEGCAALEADSIAMRDAIVAAAEAAEKVDPWASIIEIALVLHREIEAVDKALHNVTLIEQISKAVEAMPENKLARRITAMKIKESIGKLRA